MTLARSKSVPEVVVCCVVSSHVSHELLMGSLPHHAQRFRIPPSTVSSSRSSLESRSATNELPQSLIQGELLLEALGEGGM